MKQEILHSIRTAEKKQIAVLLDPDKTTLAELPNVCAHIAQAEPDYLFVGGSTVTDSIDLFVRRLKEELNIPVVLFPGNASQFSPVADAMLYLSLISGRNAELLIGQQVKSALCIHQSGIETIPTGYMLIDGGRQSTTEKVSQTTPIARTDIHTAVSTALAGELLGQKLIYLEAGSGALQSVPTEMISEVKRHLSIPLVVGGGIRSEEQICEILRAGADLIVIGNYFETKPEEMKRFCEVVEKITSEPTVSVANGR